MKSLFFVFAFFVMIGCSNEKPINQTNTQESLSTGLYKEHYPNGQLKIKGDLVNNVRQGKWESFYENGQLWSETNYSDGIKNGQTKSFYPNGNLRFLGYYKNDTKYSQWFFYNENGQFEKEIDYNSI